MQLLSRRNSLAWVLAAVALAVVSGCPGPGTDKPIRVIVSDDDGSGETRPSASGIIELAKREGELWWYTSLPGEQAGKFLDLFEAKHPFLTVHLQRESTFDTIRQVQAQIDSGEVQADVIHVLDVAIFVKLRKQGQLLRYSSPEERHIPARYKDSGYWAALRSVGLCIAYDPAQLRPSEAPSTWTDLLDERWRGRIALKDAQTAGSAYAQYYFLKEEYGLWYWRQMAAQNPRILKTADESFRALQDGEVAVISGAMGYSVHEAQKNGISVSEVWPSDGVPMMLGPVAILRGAPHRNAARLFMDFALSQEGQLALRDLLGAHSVREDVPPPPQRKRLSELNIMTPMVGWEEYAQNQENLMAQYTGFFHPGSE